MAFCSIILLINAGILKIINFIKLIRYHYRLNAKHMPFPKLDALCDDVTVSISMLLCRKARKVTTLSLLDPFGQRSSSKKSL